MKMSAFQRQVADTITAMTLKAKATFREDITGRAWPLIDVAGAYAHALHLDLEHSGQKIKHSRIMLENRRLQPNHPEFYCHLHALEDLIEIINSPDQALA